MDERFFGYKCKACGNQAGDRVRRIDGFERIALAEDPQDPNYGLYYLDTVYILECGACSHRQEWIHKRWPFATLKEAQRELDSVYLSKG
ncbi:MAG: hypothetical protein ACE5LU_06125 [Anaerolineae bacterium]